MATSEANDDANDAALADIQKNYKNNLLASEREKKQKQQASRNRMKRRLNRRHKSQRDMRTPPAPKVARPRLSSATDEENSAEVKRKAAELEKRLALQKEKQALLIKKTAQTADKAKELEQQMAKLQEEAEAVRGVNDETHSRLQTEQAAVADALAKANQLKAELMAQHDREEKLREQATSVHERETRLHRQMSQLAKQTAAEQQKLEQELASHKERHQAIEAQHTEALRKAEASNQALEDAAMAKAKLQQELDILTSAEHKQKLQAQLDEAHQAERNLAEQKQRLADNLAVLKTDAQKAQQAQAELQTKMEAEQREKDEEIARIRAQLEGHDKDLAEAVQSSEQAMRTIVGAQEWNSEEAERVYYAEIGAQIGGEPVEGYNGWYSMLTEDEQIYYYHAETEESSWEHPSQFAQVAGASQHEKEADYFMSTSEEMRFELTDLFYKFDADGSGYIDRSELSSILSQLGYPEALIAEQVARSDYDGDGQLSFDEFVTTVNDLQLAVSFKFQKYDQDGSGYIEEAELCLLLADLGFDVAACNNAIWDLDTDGDGALSFDEFAPVYRDLRAELRCPALAKILRAAGLSDRIHNFLSAGLDSVEALKALACRKDSRQSISKYRFITLKEGIVFRKVLLWWHENLRNEEAAAAAEAATQTAASAEEQGARPTEQQLSDAAWEPFPKGTPVLIDVEGNRVTAKIVEIFVTRSEYGVQYLKGAKAESDVAKHAFADLMYAPGGRAMAKKISRRGIKREDKKPENLIDIDFDKMFKDIFKT